MTQVYQQINLAATAEKEVQQDELSITFSALAQDAQAIVVQDKLKEALAQALTIVLPHKKGSQVSIDPGAMRVQPRYDNKGKMTGYLGSVDLTIRGTDTKTVAGFTGAINSMTVSNTAFSVSRQKRKSYEKALTKEAIKLFRENAMEATEAFGGTSYKIASVSIGAGYRNPGFRAASLSMSVGAAPGSSPNMGDAAGKEILNMSVQGVVQFE